MRGMAYLPRLGATAAGPRRRSDCGRPSRPGKEVEAYFATAQYLVTKRQEMYAPERDAQVRATGDLGDKPLVVLTAGDHSRDFAAGVSPAARTRFEHTWYTLQSELAALSTDSNHRMVEGAGHSTLQTDQENAQETIAAIVRVIKAVHSREPLTG